MKEFMSCESVNGKSYVNVTLEAGSLGAGKDRDFLSRRVRNGFFKIKFKPIFCEIVFIDHFD